MSRLAWLEDLSPDEPLHQEACTGPQATARDRLMRYAPCLLPTALFLVALAIRLIDLTQPLVENFIDRQVHTAMMARNLARGGSLFYPQIDIGPFPAYYMLEFPGYPAVAATVAFVTRLPLDAAGRLVSALAMAIACLLLYDLVRCREGVRTAVLAGLTLAVLPVSVRYGRAFQPDATMIALVIAGVWAMDRWAERGARVWLAAATLSITLALLLKIIAAYVLIPLAYVAWCRCGGTAWRRWELWGALGVIALPCAAWYVHAWSVASGTETVSTPFWHAHKWIAPAALVSPATYRSLAYYVGLRVLTPIGVGLALVGLVTRPAGPRRWLFHAWAAGLLTYFPILVRKLDHEHYYLAIAPVAAVFIARALGVVFQARLDRRLLIGGRCAAWLLGVGLGGSALLAAASTFRVPPEWRDVTRAAAATRALTPDGALVAGHSAVLFYADRHGFAFAYRPHEVRYLVGTWGEAAGDASPMTLLEFYRARGAEYFVELLGTDRARHNPRFFEELRRRYAVLREVPGAYIVIALEPRAAKTLDNAHLSLLPSIACTRGQSSGPRIATSDGAASAPRPVCSINAP